MHRIRLADPADFAGWRDAARGLLSRRIPPEEIIWVIGDEVDLFAADAAQQDAANPHHPVLTVPRRFLDEAASAALHRDPSRHVLLYRLLWRLQAEPRLLDIATDPDVARLADLARAVCRDVHKMHAFVRFREVDAGRRFVAWYEPDNHIVEAAAPFFMRRFATMNWAILTPERSAFWDTETLSFGPGAQKSAAPGRDDLEALWRGYYSSMFNPARVNPRAMKAELPVRFWKNLPEAELIRPLITEAPARTREMIATAPISRPRRGPAPPAPLPVGAPAGTLDALREEASVCRLCPLWEHATQTIFGEGDVSAEIMLIGEQPGDHEDIEGHPFVGPAGRLLDQALAEAELDRKRLYVTNAVKHFKFEPRGKRRIHKKPGAGEIRACSTWLQREIELVKPRLLLLLGASAAAAVLGRAVPVKASRGRLLPVSDNRKALVTTHPAFILRLQSEAEKAEAYASFVADLRLSKESILARRLGEPSADLARGLQFT